MSRYLGIEMYRIAAWVLWAVGQWSVLLQIVIEMISNFFRKMQEFDLMWYQKDGATYHTTRGTMDCSEASLLEILFHFRDWSMGRLDRTI